MTNPTILFMGTPDFAVPTLACLADAGYPIAGVVTQQDKRQGRGKTVQPSPVKIFAQARHLPVLQPESVNTEDFLRVFREISPDFVIVAAYGQLLPKAMVLHETINCINVHPSLLPKYRGAAPINRAIIDGEKTTGVSIMHMAEDLDAGDIILQEETSIGEEETFDRLYDRLAHAGAKLLVRAIGMIRKGTARRVPQDATFATYAPKLKKEEGLIAWDQDCRDIVNRIRGLSSFPGAYTFVEGKKLKILGARAEKASIAEVPGTIVRSEGGELAVAASNGTIHLLDVQMESKKRMTVGDFLRGYPLRAGNILGR